MYTENTSLTDTKTAVQSLGVWGSLLALSPAVLEIANQVLSVGQSLSPHVAAIVSGVGALVALFGRLKATKKITSIT